MTRKTKLVFSGNKHFTSFLFQDLRFSKFVLNNTAGFQRKTSSNIPVAPQKPASNNMLSLVGQRASSQFQRRTFGQLPPQPHTFFNPTPLKVTDSFNIPKLPILENMSYWIKELILTLCADTAIFALQHILPTTASLFDVIIDQFQIPAPHLFVTGKFYSTCPNSNEYMRQRGIQLMPSKMPRRPGQFQEQMHDTLSEMWEKLDKYAKDNKNIKKIIIFDEGGHCLSAMPPEIRYKYAFSSLEQTRFGLYSDMIGTQLFSLVNVAHCVAKKRLESPLIADAVLKRVKEFTKSAKLGTIFGVVGNGAIGNALTRHLLSLGFKVVIYDESEHSFQGIYNQNCIRVSSVAAVISGCHIVFGCTGRDITKGLNILSLIKHPITFVSCSSQDIEFQELLQVACKAGFPKKYNENFSSINIYSESGAEIIILENGFPINFDKSPASDPVNDMELTRGLLLGAFIQALTVAQKPIDNGFTLNKGQQLQLDPYIQQFVVSQWIKNQPPERFAPEEIECFNNIEWIIGNSQGTYIENPLLKQAFQQNHFIQPPNIPSFTRR